MPFVISAVTRIPQQILSLGGTGLIIMVGVVRYYEANRVTSAA